MAASLTPWYRPMSVFPSRAQEELDRSWTINNRYVGFGTQKFMGARDKKSLRGKPLELVSSDFPAEKIAVPPWTSITSINLSIFDLMVGRILNRGLIECSKHRTFSKHQRRFRRSIV
jgi:hypothetical protein